MASIGHVMIGMAGAKLARRGQRTIFTAFTAMVIWGGLSLVPDLDIFGFPLGVRYEAPWGHRGATHSIVFATFIASLVWLIAKQARLNAWRTALIAEVVVVSHGFLDSLTDGGLGCALFWPFTNERFFAPWRPLPVAPIGRDFLSLEGLRVSCTELVVFLPFLVYALWPTKPKAPA